jgi:hypothetical protein
MNRLYGIGVLFILISLPGCAGWGPGGSENFVGPLSGIRQGVCSTCLEECTGDCRPLARLGRALACAPGCGEVYYGEWLNNPPEAEDGNGHALGIPMRIPWLSAPFSPCGIKYRQNGLGYGNPMLPTHRGWADYGGYRPGYWGQRVGHLNGRCSSGSCSGDCGNPGCAPDASPEAGKLKPIPKVQSKKGATQVHYVSPLVKTKNSQPKTRRGLQ